MTIKIVLNEEYLLDIQFSSLLERLIINCSIYFFILKVIDIENHGIFSDVFRGCIGGIAFAAGKLDAVG